jgi:hypothetical protein
MIDFYSYAYIMIVLFRSFFLTFLSPLLQCLSAQYVIHMSKSPIEGLRTIRNLELKRLGSIIRTSNN